MSAVRLIYVYSPLDCSVRLLIVCSASHYPRDLLCLCHISLSQCLTPSGYLRPAFHVIGCLLPVIVLI